MSNFKNNGGINIIEQNKPFSELLKKGNHPYELFYFDIKVLKDFTDDPRYYISNFDERWNISIKTESDDDEKIHPREKIVLDNIGWGYDEIGTRVIAIFLKQLSNLPSQMQLRFYSYLNETDVYLDKSFINSINAHWSSETSIFKAILYEILEINNICEIIFNDCLFEDTFEEKRPEDFRLILLPTIKEYNNFISSVDKMVYDNVNKEFFKSKLEKNWKTIKRSGSLDLLSEWLTSLNVEQEKIDNIINSIDDVRQERNIVSHEIHDNELKIEFYEKQCISLLKIYHALKLLIEILIECPNLNEYELDKWFIDDKIRTYSLEEIKQEKYKNYKFM